MHLWCAEIQTAQYELCQCKWLNFWTWLTIWSPLEFMYNLISINTTPKWTWPKCMLVPLCLLVTAELLLLSWPSRKTSQGTGLLVSSHSRFLLQRSPVFSCGQSPHQFAMSSFHFEGLFHRRCWLVWYSMPMGFLRTECRGCCVRCGLLPLRFPYSGSCGDLGGQHMSLLPKSKHWARRQTKPSKSAKASQHSSVWREGRDLW